MSRNKIRTHHRAAERVLREAMLCSSPRVLSDSGE
jgi:hypothetical protein